VTMVLSGDLFDITRAGSLSHWMVGSNIEFNDVEESSFGSGFASI
jgi:hypothetical protein